MIKEITAIEPQKRNKHRFNLYIDGTFAMGIDEDVVIKHSLSSGKKITDEFLEAVLKTEENSKAFNTALSFLSFKARSKQEIQKKLNEKGYSDNSIEYAITKLEEYGYVNDYSYGKAYISDKQNIKKAGKNLLKQELNRKGIDRELIDQLIEENVDEQDEYQRALELAQKKHKSINSEDKRVVYRKISGLLARKGYSFDIISQVLKEVL